MDLESVLVSKSSKQYSNDSSDLQQSVIDEWYRYDLYTGGAITAAYSLVFLVGLSGNILVVFAVMRGNQEMRNCVTNIFLVNLAVADLLVIITCLPFTLIANLFHRKALITQFTK